MALQCSTSARTPSTGTRVGPSGAIGRPRCSTRVFLLARGEPLAPAWLKRQAAQAMQQTAACITARCSSCLEPICTSPS